MSILNYNQLVNFRNKGFIDCPIENINGSSIDLTISDVYLKEQAFTFNKVIDLTKQSVCFNKFKFSEISKVKPGEFIIASTNEFIKLPLNISALLMLKSSIGRNGLEHMNAGWIDAGFHGNITLEFKNMTQYHHLKVTHNMKIVQLVFFEHSPVPIENSYIERGQYLGQQGVTKSLGTC